MKICVFNSCDCNYILQKPHYPILMLKSFRAHFGNELDYILVVGDTLTKEACDLIPDWIQVREQNLKGVFSAYVSKERLWPQSVNWYVCAPIVLLDCDFAINCDGDMSCHQKFNISDVIPTNEDVTVARFNHMDARRKRKKPCYANAGFQVMNVRRWCKKEIWSHYKHHQAEGWYKSEQSCLNHCIQKNLIDVKYVPKWYNYLLPDSKKISWPRRTHVGRIFIAHFTGTKPHIPHHKYRTEGGIKDVLAKEFMSYSEQSKRC